jgi:hypothetical protein
VPLIFSYLGDIYGDINAVLVQDLNMGVPIPDALKEGDYAFLEKELKISQAA